MHLTGTSAYCPPQPDCSSAGRIVASMVAFLAFLLGLLGLAAVTVGLFAWMTGVGHV